MKNIEQQFREKLNRHSIEPSANAWERLESQLPKDKNLAPIQRKLRWIWVAASAVVILIVSGLLWFRDSSKITKNNDIVETPSTEIRIENKTIPENEILSKTDAKEIATSFKKRNINTKETIDISETNNEIYVVSSEEKKEENVNQYDSLSTLEKIDTTQNRFISAKQLLALVESTDIEKTALAMEKEMQSPYPNRKKLEVNAQLLLSQIEKRTPPTHRTNLLEIIFDKYEDFKERIAYEQSK